MSDAYAQYAAGKQSRDLYRVNADFAHAQARDARPRAEVSVARLREAAQGVAGAQRTAFAGQGVEVDSGSALALQEDTARLSERDVVQIRNNAARERWGYKAQARMLEFQGAQAYHAGKIRAWSEFKNTITDIVGAFVGGVGGGGGGGAGGAV